MGPSVMRDLSHDRALISINSMTVKAWSLEQLVEGCARAGISAISPWRDIVQACGPERAGKLIRAHDLAVTGLCRGGMFPAADAVGRAAAIDDNRRAIDEAAAVGARISWKVSASPRVKAPSAAAAAGAMASKMPSSASE